MTFEDSLQAELEKTLLKKITGVANAHTDRYYIYHQLSHGKREVMWSESPIHVEVETEQ